MSVKAFHKLETPEEIKEYLKRVHARTGGRSDACIYHYTNITNLKNMIESGYIWLTPAIEMNDILEERILKQAGIKDIYYTCFSRTNQNIAMFRIYAPNPGGVMLSITVNDAKMMTINKPYKVVDEIVTEEEVDAELFWTGVCYKNLDSDIITTPDKRNMKIREPLSELAGVIKMSGWSYEKEVRLCATARLYPEEKLAVKLPLKINVILGPDFSAEKYRDELAFLKMKGINPKYSDYENWVKFK